MAVFWGGVMFGISLAITATHVKPLDSMNLPVPDSQSASEHIKRRVKNYRPVQLEISADSHVEPVHTSESIVTSPDGHLILMGSGKDGSKLNSNDADGVVQMEISADSHVEPVHTPESIVTTPDDHLILLGSGKAGSKFKSNDVDDVVVVKQISPPVAMRKSNIDSNASLLSFLTHMTSRQNLMGIINMKTLVIALAASIVLLSVAAFVAFGAFRTVCAHEAKAKEITKLFKDATHVFRDTQENGQWENVLQSFRDVRGEGDLANYPADAAFMKVFEEDDAKEEINELFSALRSEEHANPACVPHEKMHQECLWLTENLTKPLDEKAFAGTFRLLSKVRTDLHAISTGFGVNHIENEEMDDSFDMNAWVQLGEKISYHVRYGWTKLDGGYAFFAEAIEDSEDSDPESVDSVSMSMSQARTMHC
jgi:hypothetical protein